MTTHAGQEWITAGEFALREGVSKKTVLRAASKRMLTFRRRGVGARAPMEFPAEQAHRQFSRLRQTGAVSADPDRADDAPTAFLLLEAVRDLTAKVERLESAVLTRRG